MWKTARPYLIIASVALNVAFIAMWFAHAALIDMPSEDTDRVIDQAAIWCPLHRELEVTEEQWAQIEPRLQEFQTAVGQLRQQTDTKRAEMIDLIAAEDPDLDSILAKQAEILATKQHIQRLVTEHLLAEKQVLTPGQQRQLFAILRNRTSCAAGPPMSGPPPGER